MDHIASYLQLAIMHVYYSLKGSSRSNAVAVASIFL